ncbi:MAG: high-affinity branched-chain amino acid ABC transporter permease LivM [Thauera propionica]|jgi:branched-chain amino acid transport system permease protein|uniref:Branched-chain amino acid ABC transporter permease n=1 Tax=Thauera propionica TaxID=2019431 RepID=A0A235F230_9RHOO|nr:MULTISPECIES: high-affinity branched-chain amino acid ABC transporter permease LivM [Thauera]MDY0049004.1 high-affinity branched-chain amino acid ABC transporter permease LivM [Thauera propionica]OYD55338.1 branched-chain amino acid ABC transporter permease [Thauera propionica]
MSAVVFARHAMTPAERLRDAGWVAFVGLILGIPLVGLTTVDVGGRLGVETRFGLLVAAVAAVFAGRLLLRWSIDQARNRKLARDQASTATAADRAHGAQKVVTVLGWVALGASIALPIFYSDNRYVVDTATTVLIYVMLGWGLNVVVGLAGLLDLGYVAFYAVGAYSYALLSTQFGWSFWEALPVSGALAATFGILLGYPILRLRGDYLAIVTLGFGEIIRIILVNWTEFSGGPNGISSIPRPSFFGLEFTRSAPEGSQTFAGFFGLDFSPMHRLIFLYYLILVLALLTHAFVSRLRKLPVGRAWEALREDEIACKAMGMNTTNIKLSAFAIGAMLGGFAGVFFAARQGFISPESFVFTESAIILAIVVLGGMGSQMGVVLAATLLVLIPEFGRNFAEYRMLLFGLAMVLIMVWKPGGLLAHREPTLRLNPLGKAASNKEAA